MKEKSIVGPVFPENISSSSFEYIGLYDKRGRRTHAFSSEFWADDPALKVVLDRLGAEGLKPDAHGKSTKEFYPLRIERHYDKADIDAAQLMEFVPRCEIDKATTRPFPGGPLQIKAQQMRGKVKLFSLFWPVVCVVREVKETMEAAGLRGVAFEPVECIGPEAERWAGQVWRLVSTVRLPPLAHPASWSMPAPLKMNLSRAITHGS